MISLNAQSQNYFAKKVYSVEPSFRKNRITVFTITFIDGSCVEAFMDSGKVFMWDRHYSSTEKVAYNINILDLLEIWDYIMYIRGKSAVELV